MKRPISKREYVIGTFFVLAALLPLATADDGLMIDVLPPVASVTVPVTQDALDETVSEPVLVLPAIVDRA